MTQNAGSTGYMRWLPGKTTATIGRLEMLARGLVEGFVTGKHRSPHKGFSVEFAEHRQYVPGDDVRDLDWRVYGKIDRFYIKQYIEETNLRCTILLDASGSMQYRGDKASSVDGKPVSKFEYGQYLAAALTYLMIRQQDAVGLVTFDTEVRRYLPARSRASQVRRILEEIDATQPGGETGVAAIFHDIAERIHRRGMVIVISDLFDNAEEILKALYHFHYRKHEVVVCHIMAEEELTFPFETFTHFRNLEAAEHVLQIDPKTIKALYLDRVREFIKTLERGCGQMRADYVPMNTNEPFERALASYMTHRRGMKK